VNVETMRTIAPTQGTLDGWAALSGDHNPLHTDPAYAAETPFGTTIAHGHWSLALMEELLLGIAGERWRYGGTLRKVRFRAPVRPGAQYVLTASADPSAGDTWRLEVRDTAGDVLAAEAEAVILDEPAWTE
jgi:acyl dehydratase